MKRSSPEDGFEDEDQKLKRPKLPTVKHHCLAHLQPGASLVAENPQDVTLVEKQLTRAICVALYSSGFDSVQQTALEGFRALVETYMSHFALRVSQSMETSRRRKPIAQDFIHALAQFGLSSSSLDPHLKLRIPPEVTQAPVFPPAPDIPLFEPMFAAGLNEKTHEEKTKKPYIPKHFPNFPSAHAYKDTPTYTERETDARKIREHATQEGILAEQALRKLMAASKAGVQVGRRRGYMDTQQRRNEEVWQETMAALTQQDLSKTEAGGFGMDGVLEPAKAPEDEFGVVVNYDRAYWRQAARDRMARSA